MSEDTVRMKVSALSVDPVTGLPAVLLTDERCRVALSIAVGLGEASSIAAELNKVELERPATHQLMGALLASAGVEVEQIVIHDLRDHTFHARIHLRLPTGERVAQDGRTSDALALALHLGAEIRVALSVLDKATHLEDVGLDAVLGGGSGAGLESGPDHRPGGDVDEWLDDGLDEWPEGMRDGGPDGLRGGGLDGASEPAPPWETCADWSSSCSSLTPEDLADFADEAFGKWKM